MNNNFVPYQIALDMKSIGFDEPCLKCWFPSPNNNTHILISSDTLLPNQYLTIEQLMKEGSFLNTIYAPLYQQIFKFFRDKYNIDVKVDKDMVGVYYGEKRDNEFPFEYEVITKGFETYEEAEKELIKELIKLC